MPYGRLPRKAYPGGRFVSAEEFNTLVETVRVLRNIRGGNGVSVTHSSSGVVISGQRARGGGPAPMLAYQPVWLKMVRGFEGDAENRCTWEYDAWPLGADISDDERRLFQDKRPLTGRMATGKYQFDLNTTPGYEELLRAPGMAIFCRRADNDPEWHLWYVPGERLADPSPCQPCGQPPGELRGPGSGLLIPKAE